MARVPQSRNDLDDPGRRGLERRFDRASVCSNERFFERARFGD